MKLAVLDAFSQPSSSTTAPARVSHGKVCCVRDLVFIRFEICFLCWSRAQHPVVFRRGFVVIGDFDFEIQTLDPEFYLMIRRGSATSCTLLETLNPES